MSNHNTNLERSMIEYYNNHKLEPLSLNQMLIQLKIPLKQGLRTYNQLTQQGQLITIDNNKGISYMIEGLDYPMDDLRLYLKQHRSQLTDAAEQLNINLSSVIAVYCHASGIYDKEKVWEIIDGFINS